MQMQEIYSQITSTWKFGSLAVWVRVRVRVSVTSILPNFHNFFPDDAFFAHLSEVKARGCQDNNLTNFASKPHLTYGTAP